MTTPSFREDAASQIPALQLLMKLGYTYLTPEEALVARGGKMTSVLLEEVLRHQLKKINSIQRSTRGLVTYFSDANIEAGIQALKDLPFQDGYIAACEAAYNRITLGKALEQSIDGDKKSFTLQYIDWDRPENNVYHVCEEFAVTRAGRMDSYRPDIVLFVNGIPLCIIECKRPDMKEPLSQAISQHIRNQMEDGIRSLYAYGQLLMALACFSAKYATTDTKSEFWASWKEETNGQESEVNTRQQLLDLVNTPLTAAQKAKLYTDRLSWDRSQMDAREGNLVQVSVQDEYLYYLCRPVRLLLLLKDYILFEGGTYKKIARYQQFFTIEHITERIQQIENGRRKGGVIWHTQGSGKSLTMAMLARRIHQTVRNAKIILVTDRIDLDTQITRTFSRVDIPVHHAKTGVQLVSLLQSKSDAVVTTIINKFQSAVERLARENTSTFLGSDGAGLESPDIFVLIDEGHRTQYGTLNVKMQKVLPNACFLAFTGTPLMKKEKSTATKFGGLIAPAYTIRQAVDDGAIVPILYEGRHAMQDVNQAAIDKGFSYVSEDLNKYEQADLKKKYSQAGLVKKTEQRIDEIARNITEHFYKNWGVDKTGERSGFKGIVVTPDKATAIKYKKTFDLIGKVTTEVVISAPDNREGNEDPHEEPRDDVVKYWRQQETKWGKNFEERLINSFKTTDYPELLIVVDKLLTGFDEPRVVVMYLCRALRGHTLLQAIARVNRVAAGKDWGYIIDYEGIIGELDEAMNVYASLEGFEAADLEGTVSDIQKEIARLPQAHSAMVDLFKTLPNKLDIVSYAALLADEALRDEFYEKFSHFARLLKLATASIEWDQDTQDKIKERYRNDLRFYTALRNAVVQQYSDKIDFKQYEKQLQKLLDQHVTTDEIIRLTEQVSIMDTEAFEAEVEKIIGDRAKAETIASRTAKHISQRMGEDPVFYKKLSELIAQTIADLRAQRLSEAEALKQIRTYRDQAIHKNSEDIPAHLRGSEATIAFYRLGQSLGRLTQEQSVQFARQTDQIIRDYLVVDWQTKLDVLRKMNFYIGEYAIDELSLPIDAAEQLAEQSMEIAKLRYRA